MTDMYGKAWSASLRRGTEGELRGWLELALRCADAADAIAMQHFRRDLEISTKPDSTYVTQADRAIEEMARDHIRERHPDHGIVGEEYGEDGPGAPVRWFIDPIDGTHNYLRGIPIFATLLAVERDGELQVGVLSAPALGERWFAWRGGGAWAARTSGARAVQDGQPGGEPAPAPRALHVSRIASVTDAQLLHSSEPLEHPGLDPGLRSLLRRAWRVRGFGDFWSYALVAEGAAEVMVEDGVHSWDLAAPMILVEEAGGRFTDVTGRRRFDAGSGVATNGLLHEEVLRSLVDG